MEQKEKGCGFLAIAAVVLIIAWFPLEMTLRALGKNETGLNSAVALTVVFLFVCIIRAAIELSQNQAVRDDLLKQISLAAKESTDARNTGAKPVPDFYSLGNGWRKEVFDLLQPIPDATRPTPAWREMQHAFGRGLTPPEFVEEFQASCTASSSPVPVDLAEQVQKLADLRDRGLLTEDEFLAAKARVLTA